MTHLSSVPQAWRDALAVVQRAFPSAVIAGGALRDVYFGLPVKDLDVFVSREENHTGAIHHIAVDPWEGGPAVKFHWEDMDIIETPDPSPDRRLGWLTDGITLTEDYTTSMRGEVAAIEGFNVPGLDLPLQVIHTNLPPADFAVQVLRRMDIAACQVAYTGDMRDVVVTPEFVADYQSRHWTVVRCDDVKEAVRTRKRIERFKVKAAKANPPIFFDTRKLAPFEGTRPAIEFAYSGDVDGVLA